MILEYLMTLASFYARKYCERQSPASGSTSFADVFFVLPSVPCQGIVFIVGSSLLVLLINYSLAAEQCWRSGNVVYVVFRKKK